MSPAEPRKRGIGFQCPNCGRELFRLGNAKSGKWVAGNTYRCNDCPVNLNRFTLVDGKLIEPGDLLKFPVWNRPVKING